MDADCEFEFVEDGDEGVSVSTARMTHVVGELSVVITKSQIFRWSSNSRLQVKSSFHVRPLFFQRQVTLAEVVTMREPGITLLECCTIALRSQWVAMRSKYERMAMRPSRREAWGLGHDLGACWTETGQAVEKNERSFRDDWFAAKAWRNWSVVERRWESMAGDRFALGD
jgi:hypothetical protein